MGKIFATGLLTTTHVKWASLVIAIPFFAGGTYGILAQHRRLTTFRPTDAIVAKTWVEERVLRRRYSEFDYIPRVEYVYQVEGKTYTCNQVSSFKKQGGRPNWAKVVIARYAKGDSITAYYDPKNPSDAFLVREYIFAEYYGAILVGVFFLSSAIVAGVFARFKREDRPSPVSVSPGWFEIRVEIPLKVKAVTSALTATLWYFLGVLTCGHYFYVSDNLHGDNYLIWISIYALLGLIPVCYAAYYFLIALKVADVKLWLDKGQVFSGDQITIKLVQAVSDVRDVEQASISLVCDENLYVRKGTNTKLRKTCCFEDTRSLLEQVGSQSPGELEGEFEFSLPKDANPSSSYREMNRPFHVWYFKVGTKLRRTPQYRVELPICVGLRGSRGTLQPVQQRG